MLNVLCICCLDREKKKGNVCVIEKQIVSKVSLNQIMKRAGE